MNKYLLNEWKGERIKLYKKTKVSSQKIIQETFMGFNTEEEKIKEKVKSVWLEW